MAADAALDLGEVLIFAGALMLAYMALVLARALANLVSFLPWVGGAAESALTAAIVDPLKRLAAGTERRMVEGLSSLLDNLAALLAIPLLLGYGVYKGFAYLWHEAIKPLVAATTGAASKVAHQALALAKVAEKDAAHALHVAENVPTVDVPKLVRAIDDRIDKAVTAGVSDAEKYAAQLESTVTNAVAGAAAELPRLPDLGFDELKKLLDGEDLTKLAGLLAAVPLLNSLVNTLTQEAGLSRAECRDKVKGICGTDPTQWLVFLAGLAALGFTPSLAELAKVVEPVVRDLVSVVAEAA